ncbi:MAG TPA: penicillin-binding transpeptidase domain-containing protein [Planctomicrobium sp.]|nr:penicillin-binding transpeptidase domain-containing protein [Planctomicrobium sp.]
MRNQPFSQLTADWIESTGQSDRSRRRPFLLALLILAFQIPIMLRLFYIQVVVGDRFIEPWRVPLEEMEIIPARDGRIVSRDGVVLAQDVVQYDVAVDYRWLETPMNPQWLRRQGARELTKEQRRDPQQRQAAEARLQAHRESLLKSLAQTTGHSETEISANMAEIQRRIESMLAAVERRRRERAAENEHEFDWSEGLSGIPRLVVDELTRPPERFADDPIILKEELQAHTVIRNVPLQVAAMIQSQPDRFRGVSVRSTSSRSYPNESLASHVVGVRRQTTNETSGAVVRQGESGVERSQQATLQGTSGETKLIRDRHGDLLQSEVIRPPRDGADVVLTIDSRLQQLGEQLLDQALYPPPKSLSSDLPIPQGGCLLAMDVWTGDVLTLAASPRVSLNVLARPTADEWRKIQDDPSRPLFSRAVQMALPPGELLEIITMAAALESGVVATDEVLHCQADPKSPDRLRCRLLREQGIGHGQLTLGEALSQSCHVCFYDVARRMGPVPLLDWGTRFGLGQPTGIDLPGEVAGKLPALAAPTDGSSRVSGETLQLAVGQGAVLTSPLQMARVLAAIANGGYLVTPRIVKEMPTENAESEENRSFSKIPGLSPSALSLIQQSLEQSVSDPRGVGHAARIELLRMGALCGTGAVAGKPGHSWMAGYAPAQNPRMVIVLVLENGGAGENAAPLFRDFVTELLGYGELRPFQPGRSSSVR